MEWIAVLLLTFIVSNPSVSLPSIVLPDHGLRIPVGIAAVSLSVLSLWYYMIYLNRVPFAAFGSHFNTRHIADESTTITSSILHYDRGALLLRKVPSPSNLAREHQVAVQPGIGAS